MDGLPAARAMIADLMMVLPTHNERERIADIVTAVFAACVAHGIELKLVIVDDNSPDGTGAIADDLARTHRVRVIHRPGKLGLGTAVVEGFGVASAEVVGVMDADFSHPPALVPRMLATFKATAAAVVVASRYVPGGSMPDWPLRRRLLSRARTRRDRISPPCAACCGRETGERRCGRPIACSR